MNNNPTGINQYTGRSAISRTQTRQQINYILAGKGKKGTRGLATQRMMLADQLKRVARFAKGNRHLALTSQYNSARFNKMKPY